MHPTFIPFLLLILAINAINTAQARTQSFQQQGIASYYAQFFNGRLTANGERHNPNALVAAHKTLPFGTKVRVTNLNNGRQVIVRINDRGPFVRGRVIDLSRAAAKKINLLKAGIARVKITRLK